MLHLCLHDSFAISSLYCCFLISIHSAMAHSTFWQEQHQKYSLPEKQLLKEQKEIDELLNVCEVLRNSKPPLVRWLSQKLKAATTWPVGTVGNPSAIVATRELVDITISGNADSCANILFSIFFVLIQKLKDFCHLRSGNCELFEHNNQGRRFRLDEDPDDDDPEELEPELPWLCPCPICGCWNEKVSNSL